MGLTLSCNGETVLEYEMNPNHERIFNDLKIGSYECFKRQQNDNETPDETLIVYTDTLRLTRQDIDYLRKYLTGNNFNELKFEWEYAKKKLRERVPTTRQTIEDLLLEITPTVLETQYDYQFLETIFSIVSYADKHHDQTEFTFTGERTDLHDNQVSIQDDQASIQDNQVSPTATRPWESGAD